MNKIPLVALLAVVATGCDLGANSFQHQSTLYQATRGLALEATPSGDARVGMSGSTCDVDPRSTALGNDIGYPGEDDEVQDLSEDGRVVVTTKNNVFVHEAGDGWLTPDYTQHRVPAVEIARVLDTGVVTFGGGNTTCEVTWVGTDAPSEVSLKPNLCPSVTDLAADPTTGQAFVGTTIGTYTADPGSDTLEPLHDAPADVTAWDAVTGLLYTADLAADTVRALDPDGGEVWTVTLEGDVVSLDDMGLEASVAVNVSYADGSGAIVILDGYTGTLTESLALPSAGDKVYGSRSGSQLAIVDGDRVEFFERGSPFDFGDALEIGIALMQ